MTPLKRPLAAAGAAVLLALSLSACGGGAPTDASEADFCEAVQGNAGSAEFGQAFQDEDWDKLADLIKEQLEEIEEVGTPEDIPDDAREGFEIQLDQVGDLSADDVEKAFTDGEDNPFAVEVSDEEKEKVEAFTAYQVETCTPEVPDVPEVPDPEDVPSIDPSDLPTDVPSLDPSDIPSFDPEELESLESELEKFTETAPAE